MSPEVQEAVNDILHKKDVSSANQWLQREYARLMMREVEFESKLKKMEAERNGGPSTQNRTT